jgi:hypothetical protein
MLAPVEQWGSGGMRWGVPELAATHASDTFGAETVLT